MIVPEHMLVAAQDNQEAASQDGARHTRLVAGPGVGKSRCIGNRVVWLVSAESTAPRAISVVSFTRASAYDLQEEIRRVMGEYSFAEDEIHAVRVGTLHALALRILKAAGRLEVFPAPPRVLDAWEMDNIFDAEMNVHTGVRSKTRREEIRLDHEAYWSTNDWTAPGLPRPDPPISEQERTDFHRFYRSRTSLYAYVLPSDITRRCLDYLSALPTEMTLPFPIDHFLVDEYQDLNPVDLALIGEIADRGTNLFVAGDDDQSIYFFRYASPRGIQQFSSDYPGASLRELSHCFRCPLEILSVAERLLNQYGSAERIEKHYMAVPSQATPPIVGSVHRWTFGGWVAEANAIAQSCKNLIDSGLPASEIAILLSNKPAQRPTLCEALEREEVPFSTGEEARFADTSAGRLALALIRWTTDSEDLVALRTIVGIQSGVGPATCNEIAQMTIDSGIRYDELLDRPVPDYASTRARRAIEDASEVLAQVDIIDAEGPIEEAGLTIAAAIGRLLGEEAQTFWQDFFQELPGGMTVTETQEQLSAPTARAASELMSEVRERLDLAPLEDALHERSCVNLTTLHSSKGLSFGVVFIPGLESGFIPSTRALPYQGLIQEAARLLYVGITRAELSVVLSHALYRMIFGSRERRTPSQFIDFLGQRFDYRDEGLTEEECRLVIEGFTARNAEL